MAKIMADELFESARQLSLSLAKLRRKIPAGIVVYDPSDYAAEPYKDYLTKYCNGRKRVLMLGMNPGPWGMAQTGVPFGSVSRVRDWLKIKGEITTPYEQIESRSVTGWQCSREEVSGTRLWGMLEEQFQTAKQALREIAVLNFCPLLFLQPHSRGVRNLPVDKLSQATAIEINRLCSRHLAHVIDLLQPEILVGIGNWAEKQMEHWKDDKIVGHILHPSPASPKANKGFAKLASYQLEQLGVFAVRQ